MKLAYFSPLPPAPSGIADHSAELLPYLAAHAHITLFSDQPQQVDAALQQQFDIRPLANYPHEQWHYDLPIYHMGNSALHNSLYQMSLRYPGLLILHDVGLHHFFLHRTIEQGDTAAYSRELGFAQGLEGINRAWQARAGQRPYDPFSLALHNRLLATSLGVVVHSQYAYDQIISARPPNSNPPTIIPELMQPQTGQPMPNPFPDSQNGVIFASLGQVTPNKQIQLVLNVMAQLQADYPIYYLIVGQPPDDGRLANWIEEKGLHGRVHCTGHVDSLQTFVDWLLLADVVINLRYPTVGETSAVALRTLAAAKPLIVFDHGWYSELPSTAVLKLPPMELNPLTTAVAQLAESASLRHQMGQAGLQYIQQHHAPQKVAAAYATAVADLLHPPGTRYA